jgi:hypothetical protein
LHAWHGDGGGLQLRPKSAVFAAAIAEKPAGRFTIRNRIRVVKRHPEGDW